MLGGRATCAEHLPRCARDDAEFVQSIATKVPGAVFRHHLDPDHTPFCPYLAGRFAEAFGLAAGDIPHHVAAGADAPDSQGLRRLTPGDPEQLQGRLRVSANTRAPVEIELR